MGGHHADVVCVVQTIKKKEDEKEKMEEMHQQKVAQMIKSARVALDSCTKSLILQRRRRRRCDAVRPL